MLNRREVLEAGMSAALAAICPPGLLGPELKFDEETSESSIASCGGGDGPKFEWMDLVEVVATFGGKWETPPCMFTTPYDEHAIVTSMQAIARASGWTGSVHVSAKHITVRVYEDGRISRR